MYKGASIFLLFLFAAFASNAVAQQPTPTPTPDTSKDDILILVNLTAEELKFDTVPTPTVEFPGRPARTTVWMTDRQNLPDKVEPGVTYRNIGIQLRISSRFEDIERIVQEALGEVPVTVDAPAAAEAKPATPTPQPPPAPAAAARATVRHRPARR